MAITMKELAFMAGVSRSTVDRVLNGRGRVNAETEQRIRALAETMGYQPNIAAKSLAVRHKNFRIGLIVNREGNTFFEDVIAGANSAAEELAPFGISVLIRSVKGLSVPCQLSLIDELAAEQVGAIAITPVNDPAVVARLNELSAMGIAVVAVTAVVEGADCLAYVGCNHEKAGRIASGLIALMTNRRANVGVVVGSLRMLGHKQRLEGFRALAAEKYPQLRIVEVVENEDDNILSYNRVSALLRARPELDVLFFAAAGTRGGVRAVVDSGRGGELKVITFDLTESSRRYLADGVVSAVLCQEPVKQGYTAIKLLGEYLMTGTLPKSRRIYTQTEIILAESL